MSIYKKVFALLAVITIALIGVSCQRDADKTSVIKLKKTDFTFKFAPQDSLSFKRIIDIESDPNGNIYVFDMDHSAIFKFDVKGEYQKTIYRVDQIESLDNPIISIATARKQMVVQRLKQLDTIDFEGNLINRIDFVGRGTVHLNNFGSVVVDRGLDAHHFNYVYHVADENKNILSRFHLSRLGLFQNNNTDFFLSSLMDDTTMVCVATQLDSVYLYSLGGMLLRSASLKNERSSEYYLDFEIEDIAVSGDHFFLPRLNNDGLSEDFLFFQIIEEYNRDLQLVNVYQLPEPITLTDPLSHWYLTYHKFLYLNDRFIFAVSQPQQSIVTYKR